MKRYVLGIFIFGLLILTGPVQMAAADIPPFYSVDVSFATGGPLSLCNVPSGEGKPFAETFGPAGQTLDGTLTVTLYSDGIPIPNLPKEDIWLEGLEGGLVFCEGRTIPDENTDENGVTYWKHPLQAGGHVEPVDGNEVVIIFFGHSIEDPALSEFRTNSPDINGDLVVNLVDISDFALSFFVAYDYASDFHWDGVINLLDLAILAQAMGAVCP